MNVKDNIYIWFLLSILALVLYFAAFGINQVFADDFTDKYIQRNPVDPRKEDIRHADDDKTDGYLQRSIVDPRKTIRYDDNHNEKGYWQKSYIDPRKSFYHEKE